MRPISEKQKQILQFIQEYTASEGYPPAVREIAAAVGLRSPSSVHAHVKHLREQPILAVEEQQAMLYIDLHGKSGSYFALHIRGDSMVNAGILSGDTIIVRKQSYAQQGQIVVALIEEEATCKRLEKQDGHVWLMPENEAYAPIPGDDARILGVVVKVVRDYDV